MGYNTTILGSLKFRRDLTASELRFLNAYLGKDTRKHPEWNAPEYSSYVHLALTSDGKGLRDGADEKTKVCVELINWLIGEVRKSIPDFGLTGTLNCQGEELGDVYDIEMRDGVAVKVNRYAPNTSECPHCGKTISLDDKEEG